LKPVSRVWALLLLGVLISGCARPASDIERLVLRDSMYFEQETLEPFTGRVYKSFAEDPSALQLSGTLKDGLWNGELTVYYSNGRVRYQGDLTDGERCGTWLENRDEDQPGDLLAQVMEEIESLAMYPSCPDS
jgi:hypothetical protein